MKIRNQHSAKIDLIAVGIIIFVVSLILNFFNSYLGSNGFW